MDSAGWFDSITTPGRVFRWRSDPKMHQVGMPAQAQSVGATDEIACVELVRVEVLHAREPEASHLCHECVRFEGALERLADSCHVRSEEGVGTLLLGAAGSGGLSVVEDDLRSRVSPATQLKVASTDSEVR